MRRRARGRQGSEEFIRPNAVALGAFWCSVRLGAGWAGFHAERPRPAAGGNLSQAGLILCRGLCWAAWRSSTFRTAWAARPPRPAFNLPAPRQWWPREPSVGWSPLRRAGLA